jgi:hypothetical protein
MRDRRKEASPMAQKQVSVALLFLARFRNAMRRGQSLIFLANRLSKRVRSHPRRRAANPPPRKMPMKRDPTLKD